jgi:uncharacterized surface protein with fasciclin (FAS1) repeats
MYRRILNATLALALVLVGFLTLRATPVQAAPPGNNLVEVAIDLNTSGPYAGQFDILITAVLAADPAILETLTGNGQFTVFAPTDAAFEATFQELGITINDLDQATLTQILLYHVARGRRNSNAVLGSSRIRTLEGGFLYQEGGMLTDEQGRTANIIVTDVSAANGLIHAIDLVVLPK